MGANTLVKMCRYIAIFIYLEQVGISANSKHLNNLKKETGQNTGRIYKQVTLILTVMYIYNLELL